MDVLSAVHTLDWFTGKTPGGGTKWILYSVDSFGVEPFEFTRVRETSSPMMVNVSSPTHNGVWRPHLTLGFVFLVIPDPIEDASMKIVYEGDLIKFNEDIDRPSTEVLRFSKNPEPTAVHLTAGIKMPQITRFFSGDFDGRSPKLKRARITVEVLDETR